MQVRYRFRIYPSPGQQQMLARTFGCARVVYNDCLRLRKAYHAAGKTISDTEMQRQKVGSSKVAWSRALPSVPSSVTVIMEPDGRYYAPGTHRSAA